MILGVLVRDVDSGNPEREPLEDPTGWGVIGAAGTRPSKDPLIPIGGDSGTNNTSTDGTTSVNLNSNWNSQFDTSFMSNAYLEEEENISFSEKTPRPNRYTLADMYEGEENLLLTGRLSIEPESLTMDSGRNSKVSENSHILGGDSASSARLHAYPLYPRLEKSTLQPSNKDIVTQPPQPIQPPRITANLIPNFRSSFSSQTSFQRIHGQQSSSTASTTSSSYNAFNYGGANGGKMTEVEKKRYELQMRVYRARTQMPSHIVLRVFREPSECVEVEEVMRGCKLG